MRSIPCLVFFLFLFTEECFFVLKFIDKYNTIYCINRHEEERRFTNKQYWRLETALLISTRKAGK